ncbi:arsenic resistance protein, partial [Bosea sp. (in: a-proteobacteria)]
IAALVVEIFAAHIEVILANAPVFATMLLAICLFFVATFILGEIVSRLAGFAYPEHALLTMTTAARNAPMMLVVTMIALPDQPLVYAAIIIGMLVEFPHLTALRQILLRGRQSDPTGPALQHGLPRSRPSAKLET